MKEDHNYGPIIIQASLNPTHLQVSPEKAIAEHRDKLINQRNQGKIIYNMIESCQFRGPRLNVNCGCQDPRSCSAGRGKRTLGVVDPLDCHICKESELMSIDQSFIDDNDLIAFPHREMRREFLDAEDNPVNLENLYANSSCFLVCSGPSLATQDLSLLNQRGILTMTTNNAASLVRSQLWTCVDTPRSFMDAIWRDPAILKFAPRGHKDIKIREKVNGMIVDTETRVRDCPNVLYYVRNEKFVPEIFLSESTFNWGCHAEFKDCFGFGGCRSVMFPALKQLFILGIRRVYLLGVDFHMVPKKPYAFEQAKEQHACDSNNAKFQTINVRLKALTPFLKEAGMEIFNCTPGSHLQAFPTMKYETAVADATAGIRPIDTKGWYI